MSSSFLALVGAAASATQKRVVFTSFFIEEALVVLVTPKLVDVFLESKFSSTHWLRLAKRGNVWVQTAGVRLPAWQFKKLVGELK